MWWCARVIHVFPCITSKFCIKEPVMSLWLVFWPYSCARCIFIAHSARVSLEMFGISNREICFIFPYMTVHFERHWDTRGESQAEIDSKSTEVQERNNEREKKKRGWGWIGTEGGAEECVNRPRQTCQRTNWKCQFHFSPHQLRRLQPSPVLLFRV